MRCLIFPAIALGCRDDARRRRAARGIVRQALRLFVGLMSFTRVLSYEVSGQSRLHLSGQLILANHPSLIDTVFLMAYVDNATCIVKSALWDNPFTYGPVRAAGYIRNTEGPELIEHCIEALRSGDNLIVFPEGSRTPRDGLRRFQRGAANIAVRGDVAVTPVVIRCDPRMLLKGEPWYAVPSRRPHFTLSVGQPIRPQQGGPQSVVRDVRTFTRNLESYFQTEVSAA